MLVAGPSIAQSFGLMAFELLGVFPVLTMSAAFAGLTNSATPARAKALRLIPAIGMVTLRINNLHERRWRPLTHFHLAKHFASAHRSPIHCPVCRRKPAAVTICCLESS